MANHLEGQTSPYLLQHVNNPVDWHPWNDEAIQRARELQRPIFLSIGYSACHWCHVMEHESFENAELAAALNEHFVSIKVDREERPDLDHLYMNAVQMMTGRGGWPMSVFLTPELEPFYAGTYWPPQGRMGMPGFDQVLAAVADAWQNRREEAQQSAQEITARLQGLGRMEGAAGTLRPEILHDAAAALERVFDHQYGGFGSAPKFPHSMDLQVLLRLYRHAPREGILKMITTTLDHMADGGIYDHLGGGFHRYSVDQRWLVPHFEKMLYDNALLANCYLEAYQATGHQAYAQVVRETLDYVLREMTSAEGGFYSTQDADTDQGEGAFYSWTPEELEAVLGADRTKTFAYVYDVSPTGNFEGRGILNRPKPLEACAKILDRDPVELRSELDQCRAELLAERGKRDAPALDDKILVAWNGLMIDAMARAAGVLREPRYAQASQDAATFVCRQMRTEAGRLLHCARHGKAQIDAFVDDYACLINALVSVYENTFQSGWIDEAVSLAETLLAHFADPEGTGFYYTADDAQQLITRVKDVMDSSVPSGNAIAAYALVRLARLTGRSDLEQAAEATLSAFASLMEQSPTSMGQMLLAADFFLEETPQIVLVGNAQSPEMASVLDDLRGRFLPNKVVALWDSAAPREGAADNRDSVAHAAGRDTSLSALFEGRTARNELPTAYVCRGFTCQAPITGKAAIVKQWEALSSGK
jgi:uncharacterized protein YyaL (SSP411 family)